MSRTKMSLFDIFIDDCVDNFIVYYQERFQWAFYTLVGVFIPASDVYM